MNLFMYNLLQKRLELKACFIMLIGVIVFSYTGCEKAPEKGWMTYRSDSTRSAITDESLSAPLSLSWIFRPTHAPDAAWMEPAEEIPRAHTDNTYHAAAAGGKVFFGSSVDNKVYALNAKTGKIAWVPANDQVGQALVKIFVSDGKGGFDTQSFNITVRNVNDPPIIISTPITTATEDKHYSYQLEAVDVDATDILVFSLELMPTGMDINSDSGLITWVPTNDQVGLNSVMVKIDDGNGGTDT